MAPAKRKFSKASSGVKKVQTDSGAANVSEEPAVSSKVAKGRKRKLNEDGEQEAQVINNAEQNADNASPIEQTGRRGRTAKKVPKEDVSKPEVAEIAQPATTVKKDLAQKTKNSEQNGDKVASNAEKTEEKATRRGRSAKSSKEKSIAKNEDTVSEETQKATADKPAKNGMAAEGPSAATTAKGKSSKKINASEALKRLDDVEETAEVDNKEGQIKKSESEFACDLKTKDGRTWNLKISCWNVGGLRSWFKKQCQDYVGKENPDIFVVQETKISESDLTDEMKNLAGYTSYFQHTDTTGKKGYAGVAMYTKIKPIKVTFGIGNEKFDGEGRLITAEFEKFYLVNAYVPNSSRGLVRLPFRQEWNKEFLEYIKKLDAQKPVIYCGDLNVAHNEIDLANPKTNKKNAGFTKEEREDFSALLNNGFTDAFRLLYPEKTGVYTFWTNTNKARERNIGWRLDYFVVSKRLEKDICDVAIRSHVMGSDHCPLTLFAAV